MRCSDGRAQLAWRPEAVGDILGVRRRSQESATAVGDPAAVGGLGTMVEHIFSYHMDRMARHFICVICRGSDLTARGRAS